MLFGRQGLIKNVDLKEKKKLKLTKILNKRCFQAQFTTGFSS